MDPQADQRAEISEGKGCKMRRGFSLIEVTTIIVILAVAITIAIPRFTRARRKNEELQAVTYLRAIRLAELMHFAKTGSYSAFPPTGCAAMTPLASAAAINTCLGTTITTGSYDFLVTANASSFTARATEIRGTCVINLPETGTFTTSGGCRVGAATLNA